MPLVAIRASPVRRGCPTENAGVLRLMAGGTRGATFFGFVRRVARRALRMLSLNLGDCLVTAPAIQSSTRCDPVRLMALEARPLVRGTVGLLVAIQANGSHPLEKVRHMARGADFVLVGQ